jgi:hypothetical protein
MNILYLKYIEHIVKPNINNWGRCRSNKQREMTPAIN